MKTALVACPQLRTVDAVRRGMLFDREGLAGQQRLVDEEVARLEQRPSAGTRSPAAKQYDVAGHDSEPGSRLAPVAQHARVQRHRSLERSAAPPARCSCTKSSTTLISTIVE